MIVALLTLVGVGVAGLGVFYTLKLSKKQLSWEKIYVSSIIKDEEDIKDDLEISFKGEKVSDVKILAIKIKNTGSKDVTSNDFEKPIKLTLNEGANILKYDIIDKSINVDIDPDTGINAENNILKIAPFLLNSGEYFTLKLIIDKYEENNIKFSSRIVGINKIHKYIKWNHTPLYVLIFFTFISIPFFYFSSQPLLLESILFIILISSLFIQWMQQNHRAIKRYLKRIT